MHTTLVLPTTRVILQAHSSNANFTPLAIRTVIGTHTGLTSLLAFTEARTRTMSKKEESQPHSLIYCHKAWVDFLNDLDEVIAAIDTPFYLIRFTQLNLHDICLPKEGRCISWRTSSSVGLNSPQLHKNVSFCALSDPDVYGKVSITLSILQTA